VANALLEQSGPLAPALAAVLAGERREAPLAEALAQAGISPAEWAAALVRAYRWAIQVSLAG